MKGRVTVPIMMERPDGGVAAGLSAPFAPDIVTPIVVPEGSPISVLADDGVGMFRDVVKFEGARWNVPFVTSEVPYLTDFTS